MEPEMPRFAAALARRLLVLLLTMLAGVLLTSLLVRLAPGSAADERQLDLRLNEQSVAALQAEKNPPPVWRHFFDLLQGQWGVSLSLGRPVRELVAERAGLTLATLGAGLGLAWAVAAVVCLGLAGCRRYSLDVAATVATGGLLCLPAAVVALLAAYCRAGPVPALAVVLLPRILRYARSILQASARRPHVMAAQARGTRSLAVVLRHVCLPAAAELLALAGVSVSLALSAVIPIEALCSSPGVGQLVWQAALARDFPVLVDLTLVIATLTCAANLLADAGRTALAWEA
jgi:peptide/nickel transport system permease protein